MRRENQLSCFVAVERNESIWLLTASKMRRKKAKLSNVYYHVAVASSTFFLLLQLSPAPTAGDPKNVGQVHRPRWGSAPCTMLNPRKPWKMEVVLQQLRKAGGHRGSKFWCLIYKKIAVHSTNQDAKRDYPVAMTFPRSSLAAAFLRLKSIFPFENGDTCMGMIKPGSRTSRHCSPERR